MSHFTHRTVQWKKLGKKKQNVAKGGTTSTNITRIHERLQSRHLRFSFITHYRLENTPLMLNSVPILHDNFALYQNIAAPSVGKTFAIHKLTILTATKKLATLEHYGKRQETGFSLLLPCPHLALALKEKRRQTNQRITEGWQNSTRLSPKATFGFLNDLNKAGVKLLGWLEIPFLE